MSTDALLIEFANLPGDIFDLEEEELFETDDNEPQTFEAFLNSNWDFWWHLTLLTFLAMLSLT